MIRNINLKEYFAVPWIKFLFWAILVSVSIAFIAIIANYLTIVVFHFK
jgi:hypothetical protein